MKIKKFLLLITLVFVMNFVASPLALAAEKGDTTVTDRKGNVYTLSNAILGTTTWTFYDNLEAGNTNTVTIYLVPKNTTITLPSNNDLYLAIWYAPDEKARDGWDILFASDFIPSGMDVPFSAETIDSDGNIGTVADIENATLRIYSTINGSVIFRGVDTDDTLTPFKDVPVGAYYLEPVSWAIEQGITKGTNETTFSPNNTCTRGEIMTFLWRAAHQPQNWIVNVYTDISKNDYFYEPARWAYANDMVPAPTFDASTPCTRSMTVTYLWKAAGSPSATNSVSFSDIPADADYIQAVAWAVENGITTGTSDNTFSPDKVCTRAEIVTFLYRTFG